MSKASLVILPVVVFGALIAALVYSQRDTGALKVSGFVEADQILWGLENGLDRPELARLFGTDAVDHIAALRTLSRPMREAPYRQPIKPSTKRGP